MKQLKHSKCIKHIIPLIHSKHLVLFLLFSSLFAPLSAQTEEEMFGAPETIVSDTRSETADTSGGLLKSEAVKIGGSFAFNFGAEGNPEDWNRGFDTDGYLANFADASANLFADARPSGDFRFFIKGKMTYAADNNSGFELREAFADIQPAEDFFVRAGKQTANWGVGYFFSPGNLLDLSKIDPEDPTAERTGPLAVKAQKPFGSNTLYGYFLLDEAATGGSVAFAPKAEFLLGSSEIAVGGLWKGEAPWAATASATFPLAALDVFAEATVKGNEDKIFIVEDSASPAGLAVETRENDLFPFVTAGFSWSKSDELKRYELSFVTQYYYNGAGYGDQSLFAENMEAVGMFLMQEKIDMDDLLERGRHYGAANLTVGNIMDSEIGLSLFWLGNIADRSGRTSVTATWDGLDHVRMSLAYAYAYGENGSEYANEGPVPSVTLKVSLTQGTF